MSNKTWDPSGDYRPKDEPVPEEVRPQRGRKDTRKWCKGKVGVEHQPETVRSPFYNGPIFADKDCHWTSYKVYKRGVPQDFPPKWACYHRIQCSVCFKVLKDWLPTDLCPTYQREHSGDND